jgi:hypothetical protein
MSRPLSRPRRRWDGIRMDLSKIARDGVGWIHLTEDRDSCEHNNEPSASTKGGKFLH